MKDESAYFLEKQDVTQLDTYPLKTLILYFSYINCNTHAHILTGTKSDERYLLYAFKQKIHERIARQY